MGGKSRFLFGSFHFATKARRKKVTQRKKCTLKLFESLWICEPLSFPPQRLEATKEHEGRIPTQNSLSLCATIQNPLSRRLFPLHPSGRQRQTSRPGCHLQVSSIQYQGPLFPLHRSGRKGKRSDRVSAPFIIRCSLFNIHYLLFYFQSLFESLCLRSPFFSPQRHEG